jgi:hypothetical protein
MIHLFWILALLAVGFGLGRVRHPANLKLSKIMAEVVTYEHTIAADAHAALMRVKALL